MTADSALARIEAWLEKPHRLYETFAIRGAAGTGKTRLLQGLADRIPEAVYIDCQGLTAEDAALRLLNTWRAEPGTLPLFEAARRITSGGVALLANVQWAGPLVSSNEASRITRNVLRPLRMSARPTVRFIVERSADKSWVLAPARNELVLQEDFGPADPFAFPAELLAAHPPLEALAAAETRSVPLPVWEELCHALGIHTSACELTGLADALTEILAVPDTAGADRQVAFRAESTRHRIRAVRPVPHAAIVTFLIQRMAGRTTAAWSTSGPLGTYAARTLALHAAHAGAMDRILGDGTVLAHLDAYGLLQGLAATWPGGVPQGGIATDAHYLEELGLASAPHPEWLAWLHHATVSRGNEALARSMAEAGITLPWRTVWSRCRPYGTFGPSPRPYTETPEGIPVSRSWPRSETAPPVRNVLGLAHPFRSRSRTNGDWLIAGPTGHFAVTTDTEPSESPDLLAMPEPFVGAITTAGEWVCPVPALTQTGPSRAWLEAAFGDRACRVLLESQLPAGITAEGARRFLTTTGLPALSDQLPFMSTVDLRESGLVESPWPEDTQEPESGGPFYILGAWTGGKVLLDGTTGAVLQDGETGYQSTTLASSLRQFCILIRLYCGLLISNFHTPHEYRDARNSVRSWADEIDSAVADADHWEQVFDGDLDSWGTE
ncbi:SUKH-4 family immunity protein [Streptomyces sp. NPDC048637]|uniref:SUKH-4 family immunity protein n=1 Tax=Streptomyces sp. NPDC048637 TaxID=3155636 RepID=UPI00344879C8